MSARPPHAALYTRCPGCGADFRLGAYELRAAMGMARCGRCGTVFNALAWLRDDPEQGAQVPVGRPGRDPAPLPGTGQPGRPWGTLRSQALAPSAPSARAPGTVRYPLGETLTLALRNVLRHRRRTALSLAAVGFGVVALLLAGGFIEWNNWALRESTIESRLGHIQIVRPGYFSEGGADPFAYLLPAGAPVLDALDGMARVRAVAPRLAFSGLASLGETTVSFLGEGVAPEREASVSRQVRVVEGRNLAPEDRDGVVLGKGLAVNLGATVGATVVLLTNAPGGGISAREARVVGIFQTTTKAFDDVALRVPIDLARRLARVEGAHSWVVLLDDTEATAPVLADLRARFPESEAGFQYVPWHDLADFYKKVVVLFTAQVDFVRAIIAVIILVSISNTLIMGVLERTAEVGTLMAIGFRRARILRLFVGEGLLLGVLGSALGTAAGLLLARVISAVGIPMPPSPGMDFSYTGEIRVTLGLAAGAFLLAVAAAVLASVYPAWKASRLLIVDALRRAR